MKNQFIVANDGTPIEIIFSETYPEWLNQQSTYILATAIYGHQCRWETNQQHHQKVLRAECHMCKSILERIWCKAKLGGCKKDSEIIGWHLWSLPEVDEHSMPLLVLASPIEENSFLNLESLWMQNHDDFDHSHF